MEGRGSGRYISPLKSISSEQAGERKKRDPPSDATSATPSLSVDRLEKEDVFRAFIPLLPAELLPVPKVRKGVGHRQRDRDQLRQEISLEANDILRSLNSLDSGFSKC